MFHPTERAAGQPDRPAANAATINSECLISRRNPAWIEGFDRAPAICASACQSARLLPVSAARGR